MNNRTNSLKKRADALAEYVVERCAKLEAENSRLRIRITEEDVELTEYSNAFFETLKKCEGIEELGDGSILIKFIAEDGVKMNQIIPVTGVLHPIAKMLFKKNNIWRIKR